LANPRGIIKNTINKKYGEKNIINWSEFQVYYDGGKTVKETIKIFNASRKMVEDARKINYSHQEHHRKHCV
jgi:hypothetical protein